MRAVICIGSVLWDVIGRTERDTPPGADGPGRITRHAGGVAFNIAAALGARGVAARLLGHVGRDRDGDELIALVDARGVDASLVARSDELATDRYMAIEGPDGLVAAIADARGLEAAGEAVIAPLGDGRLGDDNAPYPGLIALDGNLTSTLLAEIGRSPLFAAADLRLAPASPGKAERLAPFLPNPRATIYANLEEAGRLCGAVFSSTRQAAAALRACGLARALVTDGPRPVVDDGPNGAFSATPAPTVARRVTGAGDVFMAAHIAAEIAGAAPEAALKAALAGAGAHVGGDDA